MVEYTLANGVLVRRLTRIARHVCWLTIVVDEQSSQYEHSVSVDFSLEGSKQKDGTPLYHITHISCQRQHTEESHECHCYGTSEQDRIMKPGMAMIRRVRYWSDSSVKNNINILHIGRGLAKGNRVVIVTDRYWIDMDPVKDWWTNRYNVGRPTTSFPRLLVKTFSSSRRHLSRLHFLPLSLGYLVAADMWNVRVGMECAIWRKVVRVALE